MNNSYYIIAAIVEDYGKMDDGKDWKGVRLLCQECRMKDGRTISAQSCIIKANKDVKAVTGVPVIILFDRNGKAARVDEIKK